jgi:hypothetical protein
VVYLILPFVVVFISPGVNSEAFVCRVEVKQRLGATLSGKLEFLLADTVSGRSPTQEFVVTLDHGYTAGIEPVPGPNAGGSAGVEIRETPVGSVFGVAGTSMTKDVFYGEQYLFFDDYPEVYVSQVKDAFLWPSQISRLRTLYLAPFVNAVAIYWIWVSPFTEEYSLGSWLLVVARFLLVCAAVGTALVWHRRRQAWTPGIVWMLGVYAIVAVGLAVPSL